MNNIQKNLQTLATQSQGSGDGAEEEIFGNGLIEYIPTKKMLTRSKAKVDLALEELKNSQMQSEN